MYNYTIIIKLSFHRVDPANNGISDYYFSSLAAIYELFPPSAIGCQLASLWNYGIAENRPYNNSARLARCGSTVNGTALKMLFNVRSYLWCGIYI